MNIKSSKHSPFITNTKVKELWEKAFPPGFSKLVYTRIVITLLAIISWLFFSEILAGGLISGMLIYKMDSDNYKFYHRQEIGPLILVSVFTSLATLSVLGGINIHKDMTTVQTIPAKVVNYHVDNEEMAVTISLSEKFKARHVKLEISDTELFELAKYFDNMRVKAEITRTFTYDEFDKLFDGSKISGVKFTIHIEVNDLDLGSQIYRHECKNFTCSELFN